MFASEQPIILLFQVNLFKMAAVSVKCSYCESHFSQSIAAISSHTV